MITKAQLLNAQKAEIGEAALGYLACALGVSDDEAASECTVHDFDMEDLQHAIEQVGVIYANFYTIFDQMGYSPDQMGHDLWLERNGHGTGFRDRKLGDLGKAIAEYVRTRMAEVDLELATNGTPYFIAHQYRNKEKR
jgi:hypothetical protein